MSDVNSNHAHFSKTLYSASVTTHDIYIFLSVIIIHNRRMFQVQILPNC